MAHILFATAIIGAVIVGLGLIIRQPFAERVFARDLSKALAGFGRLTTGTGILASGDMGFHEIETIIRERYLKTSSGEATPRLIRMEVTNQSSGIGFGKTSVEDFHQLSLKVTTVDGQIVEGTLTNLESVIRERLGESRLRLWSNVLIIAGIVTAVSAAVINYVDALRTTP